MQYRARVSNPSDEGESLRTSRKSSAADVHGRQESNLQHAGFGGPYPYRLGYCRRGLLSLVAPEHAVETPRRFGA